MQIPTPKTVITLAVQIVFLRSLVPTFVCILALVFNATATAQFNPHTDLKNTQGWVLNEEISDEFDGAEIDESKWQICGRNGVFWKRTKKNSGFTGRGYPKDKHNTGWEFSADNVRVENGMMKIKTEYDPQHQWINNPKNYNFEYTTGGMYSKSTLKSGYIEIRCKLPVTKQVCSFWTTGAQAELDVFEAIGKHRKRASSMWSSLHDWKKRLPNSSWTETTKLPFEFADGFHVYSAEFDDSSVSIYADGELIHSVTREKVKSQGRDSKRWPLVGEQHVWVDSEVFPWWGKPNPKDLPAEYEVDYVRVWEKKN